MGSRLSAAIFAGALAWTWADSAWAVCSARPATAGELAACSAAAGTGDVTAARLVGDAMGDATLRLYDPAGALSWWEQAAAAGDHQALRRLFDAHWYGRGTGRDPAKARAYLTRAVAAGATWARLVRAVLAEGDEPALAAELYNGLAAEGHCQAQLRLAHGLDRGAGWVEKNRQQALHWAIVAGAASGTGPSESHPLFDGKFNYGDCATESFFLREDLARSLAADQKARAENSAAAWRPGRPGDRPAGGEGAAAQPVAAMSSSVARMPDWQPLPTALRRPPGRARLGAEDVFATVGRSVYVVSAARNDEDLKARKGRFGSAVAMDERTALTNCHVIEDMAVIVLRQGNQAFRATLSAADMGGDRCLMTVSPARLTAVPGVRAWDDLRVGETVYTIGAPKGLEATLGQGLISGLRPIKATRYVQTTAPIAAGSSGGGLFDSAGNLVGVTTFHLRDADGLNFAIAAEDFFR